MPSQRVRSRSSARSGPPSRPARRNRAWARSRAIRRPTGRLSASSTPTLSSLQFTAKVTWSNRLRTRVLRYWSSALTSRSAGVSSSVASGPRISQRAGSSQDRPPIGAERELDGAVGEDGRAELRELGQLQHRKQCVAARAVGGDRARAVAADRKLDEDRPRVRLCRCCLGVRRRWRQERRKQERGHGPARNHGRCSSSESRTGRAASRVSGARSSRSVVTSTRRRYGPGGSLPAGSAAVKRGSTS